MKKNIYHTVMISDIDTKMIGEEVVVSGWISNIRDHGGVLFLDLRDNTGGVVTEALPFSLNSSIYFSIFFVHPSSNVISSI